MAELQQHDDLERALLVLRDAIHALRACHQPDWLEVDLTMAQARALMVIGSAGAIHGRGLARALGVGHPAASKLVDQLVERGYVRRDDDPEDRRIVWLRLTPHGQEVFDRFTVAGRTALRAVLATLGPDELRLVTTALTILTRAAERLARVAPATTCREEPA